jgi:5-methylcytosine-specific restriction endonuclease McrA
MRTQVTLASLDALLDHLVIGSMAEPANPRERQYQEFAFERAASVVQADQDERERRRFEMRLRLALHLSPATAVIYDSRNPVPRWKLVREHLASKLVREGPECETLAREIAGVLDNWDRRRSQVTAHRAFLLNRDGPFCQNCHVQFGETPQSLVKRDPYKPYYSSPEELLSIEVDHIEAVSALGTNALANLQLLCRLCNAGKGDGLGTDIRKEAQFAGCSIDNVPIPHRCRMLYAVIHRDRQRCARCDTGSSELTVRPVIADGAYVRSNLFALCVKCL